MGFQRSAHRLIGSEKKLGRNNKAPKPQASGGCIGTLLPLCIRERERFPYSVEEYDLAGEIISLLQSLDPEVVGSWAERKEESVSANTDTRLEDFRIPPLSITRQANKGRCEVAQQYLSEAVASPHGTFLQLFDRLVREKILPHLKSRLVREGVVKDKETRVTFYYQRPPTLRLQPGPARAVVKTHRDADYGHQPGELNYWIPLTDIALTGVDLWCESDADLGDYSPLCTQIGEVSSFHGTACRHYVNRNETPNTRASLDFRVGIGPYYDPEWEMLGTKADHLRQKVDL